MSETIRVDVSEWKAFADKLDEAKPLLSKHLKSAMFGALALIQEWITQETPVNFGILRGSFGIDIRGTGTNLRGETVTPLLYGWPVEEGRRPGKMPPYGPIRLWVRRKLGIVAKEGSDVARAIQWHIAHHGTKGAHMVEQAYQRAVQGNEIEKIFEHELDQFLKELAR